MALVTSHDTISGPALKRFQNIDEAVSVGTTETLIIEWDTSCADHVTVTAKNTHATQQLFVRAYAGYNETDLDQVQLLSEALTVQNQRGRWHLDIAGSRWLRLTVQGSAATTTGEVALENTRGS